MKKFSYSDDCLGRPDGSAVAAATTHTIREGDTLWELAAKHYGDPTSTRFFSK